MLTSIRTIPVASLGRTRPGETASFRIPDYQRGYRWQAEDVTRLLEDMEEFIGEGSGGRPFYCLQPLVVTKSTEHDCWEVVDGQQRLTTLLLLCKFLTGSSPFKLSYDTRPRSESFLQSIAEKSEGDIDNIDFHHIYHSHRAIRTWFKDDETKKENFKRLLADATDHGRNVRFIWYELRDDDAVAAFTRLNVGKIPLTDEELIRALFLRYQDGATLAESAFQHRLALEWNRIETTLQAPDFWGFLSAAAPEEGGRMRLLLALCAPEGAEKTERGIFFYFEAKLRDATSKKLASEWEAIFSRFEQLQEWHDDAVTFHLVGVLATILNDACGNPLRRLLEDASGQHKSSFVSGLRETIRSRLLGVKSVRAFVTNLDYIDNNKPIRPILALFNIATLMRTKGVHLRFPFHFYHANAWDIEHVHSQSGEDLRDAKDQKKWLAMCRQEIESHTPETALIKEINAFIEHHPTAPAFDALHEEIAGFFGERADAEGSHGIGNLTLLDRSTNRAFKNALFAVKRDWILEEGQHGTFILPCTRDLFLKVFSTNPENLRRWDLEADGAAHEAEICATLEAFFDGKGGSTS